MSIVLAAALLFSCATAGTKKTSVRLLINQLKTGKGVQKATALKIEKQLADSLQKLRGNSVLFYRNRDISLSANRQLTGTIARVEASLFLSIRVIDGEKSRILFSASKIIRDNKDLDKIIEETAEEISDHKQVWR